MQKQQFETTYSNEQVRFQRELNRKGDLNEKLLATKLKLEKENSTLVEYARKQLEGGNKEKTQLTQQKESIELNYKGLLEQFNSLQRETEDKDALIAQVKQNLEKMRQDKQKYEEEISKIRS